MSKNSICWAIANLKGGEKLCRDGFSTENQYIELTKDVSGKDYIKSVTVDNKQKSWNIKHVDLLADDWNIYTDPVIEHPDVELKTHHLKGIVTVGHYYHSDVSQDNFGFYSQWGIGSFNLLSTDLFDANEFVVNTCCGYKKGQTEGFLLQTAKGGAGQLMPFLTKNKNAKLTVYIGNDKYEFRNGVKGPSGRSNYYWDEEPGLSAGMRAKYFNSNMVGKKLEITLQFSVD